MDPELAQLLEKNSNQSFPVVVTFDSILIISELKRLDVSILRVEEDKVTILVDRGTLHEILSFRGVISAMLK
jgi:hypothetical protein